MNPHTTETIITLWASSTSIFRDIDIGLGTIHGIGLSEYMVLHRLMNSANKSMRRIDLAKGIGRTASGVTRMLMPMQKIGLVKKESNARDARVSLVKITAAGEKIYGDASTTLAQRSSHLLRHLGEKDVGKLLKLLQTIAA